MALSPWTLRPNVVEALQSLISEYADLVQTGLPSQQPSLQLPRRVYVLGVTGGDHPTPVWLPGNYARKEEYNLPLALEVINFTGRSLTGAADTDSIMGDLVAAIGDQCAADPSWGGAVHASGVVLDREYTFPYADQGGTGWVAHTFLEIAVERRGA